jgi:hypothetical protein
MFTVHYFGVHCAPSYRKRWLEGSIPAFRYQQEQDMTCATSPQALCGTSKRGTASPPSKGPADCTDSVELRG